MGENRLFDAFPGIDKQTWIEKIEKDLKGKPLEVLNFKPEFDLEAQATYHPEDFKNQIYSNLSDLAQDNNDWFITEAFIDADSKATNQQILKVLNQGTTGIQVNLTPSSDIAVLFDAVLLEHIYVHIVFCNITQVLAFKAYTDQHSTGALTVELPGLTEGLTAGEFKWSSAEIQNYLASAQQLNAKYIVAAGQVFGDFGASTVQELGLMLAQLQEWFECYKDNGLDQIDPAKHIAAHLSVHDDYFVNIAKFRAAKELVNQFLIQWDFEANTPVWINATTSVRHMTVNDRYNNLLRQTTGAMSAVIGGAKSLTVVPYSNVTGDETERAERMARNIQLILKDEAYLDKVIDPGSGAYYIESLTDQLIDKAWAFFMAIESEGGFYKAIESGYVQSQIAGHIASMVEQLNSGSQTLLGINKYQNTLEDWQNVKPQAIKEGKQFKSFQVFNLETYFEQ